MAFSSYQMERLLDRLRRWRGWFDVGLRGAPTVPEQVRLTPAATERAGAREGGGGSSRSGAAPPPGGSALLPGVREKEPYPPRVEAERERRAGSFLHPPYPEEGGPAPIPKLVREPRQRSGDRPAAGPRSEED